MAPANLPHRQTHNLLLISKLLNLRDTASPLTLLLDSLEQPATPLLKEYIRRAKVCNVASILHFLLESGCIQLAAAQIAMLNSQGMRQAKRCLIGVHWQAQLTH